MGPVVVSELHWMANTSRRGAGAAPIIYALLADLFPASARSVVSLFIVIATGAGQALGQALAGGAGLPWRVPFAVIGVPSVAVATLMLLTTTDPPRGGAEGALQEAYAIEGFAYKGQLSWSKLALLARTRTNVCIILQARRCHVAAMSLSRRPGRKCHRRGFSALRLHCSQSPARCASANVFGAL